MNILYSSYFQKRFRTLPQKMQQRFFERLELLLKNHNHPLLKVHPLKGNLVGYRAFSVTGDIRTIYRFVDRETIKLVDIGTHSQVYE